MDANRFNKNQSLKNKYMPQALAVLEEEFRKPLQERVKLTHIWLAAKLDISRGLAFPLLLRIAENKKFCIKYPAGPVFWKDCKFTPEELATLNTPREVIPESITFVLGTPKVLRHLAYCKLRILNDMGLIAVTGVGGGRALRVAGSERNFEKLAEVAGSYYYSDDTLTFKWLLRAHKTNDPINSSLKDQLKKITT